MSYVLESKKENERLKFQSSIDAYNLDEEFSGNMPKKGDHVLDAGCGGGQVCEYLSHHISDLNITGYDISELRVQSIKKIYPHFNFRACDLAKLPDADSTYDYIVSHYVYEHLSDPLSASKEKLRVLKTGGKVVAINPDGVFENFHCDDKELNEMVNRVSVFLGKGIVDVRAGRKMVSSLRQAGFKDINFKVLVHTFEGEQLKKEVANYEQRFQFLGEHIDQCLGAKSGKEFRSRFLSVLSSGQCVLFQNKFIVTAKKL